MLDYTWLYRTVKYSEDLKLTCTSPLWTVLWPQLLLLGLSVQLCHHWSCTGCHICIVLHIMHASHWKTQQYQFTVNTLLCIFIICFLTIFIHLKNHVVPLRIEKDKRICKLYKSLDFNNSLQLIFPFVGKNLMFWWHGLPTCWRAWLFASLSWSDQTMAWFWYL
jgi:hypothetical protein